MQICRTRRTQCQDMGSESRENKLPVIRVKTKRTINTICVTCSTLMERITGRNIYFYNGYSSNAYNSVERYRSPVSAAALQSSFLHSRATVQAGSCSNGSSRRDADQQSLILRQFAARTYGVIIGYLQNFVYYGTVIVLWHKSGTDTLYFMGTGLPTGKYGRIFGLHSHNLYLRVIGFKLHPHHSLCLPSLHRPRKYPPAVCITPDFLSGSTLVHCRIGRIVKLL